MSENEYRSISTGEMTDYLSARKRTLLLCHTSPDADTFGSSLALSCLLRAAGSETYCVCPDPIPEHLEFLLQSDNPFAVPADFVPERIVSVDVPSPQKLGRLWDVYQGKINMMIDHHGVGIRFADYHVEPDAAATGEIIFDLGKRFLDEGVLFRIPECFWYYCYAAISSDTGGFRYNNTTPETMRRGAELLEHGIDAAAINNELFSQKSLCQLRAETIGFSRTHLYADGKIGILTMPYEEIAKNGFSDGDLETLVDIVRQIRGVRVAVAIRQNTAEKSYRTSMRSAIDFNVADICAQFGGGGHDRAAGCTLTGMSIEDAEKAVLDALMRAM